MNNFSLTGQQSSLSIFWRYVDTFGAFQYEAFEGTVFVVLMEGVGGDAVRLVCASFLTFGGPMSGGATAGKVTFDDLGDADQSADGILIRIGFRCPDCFLDLFNRCSGGREGMQT